MKLIIKLSNDLNLCPTCWQSMIYSLLAQDLKGFDQHKHVREREINKVLSKFKATFINCGDDKEGRVEFESSKHYTLFILAYEKEIDEY
jgi:hypothetical protein